MTRLTEYFLPTEKQAPADAEALSHKLMVRAGPDPPGRRRAVELAAGRLARAPASACRSCARRSTRSAARRC